MPAAETLSLTYFMSLDSTHEVEIDLGDIEDEYTASELLEAASIPTRPRAANSCPWLHAQG